MENFNELTEGAGGWVPGEVVGRYRLLARIAIGGMAELWLVHLRERMRGREGVPDLGELRAHDGRAGSQRAAALLLDLQDRLERNANARLVLEHALLEIEGDDTRERSRARS